VEHVFDVPPGAFPAHAQGHVGHRALRPRPPEQLTALDATLFEAIVKAAFGQRRKTLRNTLRERLAEADWAALGIDATRRGEELAVDDYVRIANRLADATSSSRRC
jgi:16S rRNA (adenine1518-N6/adenine1519-N6)-dimethyltransferase